MIPLIDEMRRSEKLDAAVLATMERMAVRSALARGVTPSCAFDDLRAERDGFAAFYGEVAAARALDHGATIALQQVSMLAVQELQQGIDRKMAGVSEDVDAFARAPYREYAHAWIARDTASAQEFVDRCNEIERFAVKSAGGPYDSLGRSMQKTLANAAVLKECVETEMAAREYLKLKAS